MISISYFAYNINNLFQPVVHARSHCATLNEEQPNSVHGGTHFSISWHAKMSLLTMNQYRMFLFQNTHYLQTRKVIVCKTTISQSKVMWG